MQVTIEVRIEPKTRANRTVIVRIGRRFSASDHPPGSTRFGTRIDQGIAREAAPGFKLGAETGIATNDSQEVSRPALAERSD
jgi:D-serine deaminase-like pyridoxal phosphate-dependent protein